MWIATALTNTEQHAQEVSCITSRNLSIEYRLVLLTRVELCLARKRLARLVLLRLVLLPLRRFGVDGLLVPLGQPTGLLHAVYRYSGTHM